jgi:hypothetical protein
LGDATLDIPSLSAIVAAVGVLVGVVVAIVELRNLVKTRQTDLIMRLYSAMSEREWQEASFKILGLEYRNYDDYVQKYGSILVGTPTNVAFFTVGSFFEGIGVLLHKKLVDVDLVYDLFDESVEIWEKMKPVVEGYREQYGKEMPKVKKSLQWFEYLCSELQEKEQKLQQSVVKNG